MRSFRKNRSFAGRRAMFRRNFLRMERLEERLALTASPVAVNDFYDAGINESLEIGSPGILSNDTSSSGGALSAGLFSGPSHGTLELEDDGSFHYVPEADYEGLDSFLYFANDGGDSMLAAVTIDVKEVNHEPTAANDAFSLVEDTTFTVDAAGGLLANDADSDGDALAITITSQPLHGAVTVNADGSLSYTPEANYNGLDGFSYLVSDGAVESDVASATFIISAANDLPVGVNDEYTTAEDTPLEIAAPGVLVNDTDIDGDALSSILVSPPQHGTVTLGADGALVYTPAANFNGVDGFSYVAGDGAGNSDATAVTIEVAAVADTPVATADAYATDEDTSLVVDAAIGVLANDSDGDGDPLSATIVTGPANGTITLNADGSFSYSPNAGFNGADSFTYTAGDGTLASAETTVSLTVNPVNDAPISADDEYHTSEDESLAIDAVLGVLANDSDPDGDPLSVALVAGTANGELTLNADGSFDYTPNENFNGPDSFTYQVSDGTLVGEVAMVTIDVCAVNDAPAATADAYSLDEDTSLSVDALMGVLANDSDLDGDALTAAVVTGPANGTLTMNADGSFDYTPAANFSGTDSFVYAASDGSLESQSMVVLTVNSVAEAPVPAIDNYSTGEDVPLVIGTDLGVLANDLSPEGGALTAAVVTGPAHGALTLNADGSFSFAPEANYHGADSFTYKAISDGQEIVAVANIVIEPLNDAPVAVNDEVTIDPANDPTATVHSVVANDSDIDGDALAANLVTAPAHGTLSLNSDGTFNYTPQEGFSGDDVFRYQLFDGKANSNVATVTLHVIAEPDETPPPEETPPPAENERPLAVNDVFTIEADATLNVAAAGLLTNDSDPEGSPLTASLFSNPLHGSVSLAADGSFNYTPESGYDGMDALWDPLESTCRHASLSIL